MPEPTTEAVIRAAIRWRANMLKCRALAADLVPCEGIQEGELPCWQQPYERIHHPHEPHYCDGVFYGVETVRPTPCDACAANERGPLSALRAERARRGGLTSALARAVDKLFAQERTDA